MLSCVWLFVTPWTAVCQAPQSMRFFQARILEWVAISFYRGSSQTRDQTCFSSTGRCILYHWATWEAPYRNAAAAAKSLQLCPTLCDPVDCSLPGSSVHEILQAKSLEWVAVSFSNAWKWKVTVKSLSSVWLSATPRTVAYQAPSMGFSKEEYWSGVPLPSLVVKLLGFKNKSPLGS